MPGWWQNMMAQNAPPPRGGFGFGAGTQDLPQVLNRFFSPELDHSQTRRGPIESAFDAQTLEPGALFGAASTAAQGTASQLFAPGGEIAKGIDSVRGQAIGHGFAPGAAEGAERGVLRSGVQRVADSFASNAAQLESQRYGALTSAYGESNSGIRDLLESIFTGSATQNQYLLAKSQAKKPGLLGLGFGPL